VIVMAHSGHGAVRAVSDLQSKDVNNNENIVTQPSNKEEYYLILLQSNQSCAILGTSSYRLVTRPALRCSTLQAPVCYQ
jgi:hypothetical protein